MYNEEEAKKRWEAEYGQTAGQGIGRAVPCEPIDMYQNQTCPSPQRILTPDEIVEQLFTYHSPDPGMVERMQEIREIARLLAKAILRNSPSCADRTAAIRLLRESVMTVNAAIVLHGLSL